MNTLSGMLLSTALLVTVGCAQMRPAEPVAREAPAAAPAGEPAILRGEEAPPLPERIPPLPPDAGQTDFPMFR